MKPVSVRRASARLLRAAVPAVFRGTTLTFNERRVIYLNGTNALAINRGSVAD